MVKKGEITKDQFLFIARSFEQGCIEDKYAEIVRTDDVECRTLMQEVAADTHQYKEKIVRQIADRQQDKGYIKP